MAHFMHRGLALVIPHHGPGGGRHAAGEDVAAVGGVIGGGELVDLAVVGVGDVGGEGAVAEQGVAGGVGVGVGGEVGLEVEV